MKFTATYWVREGNGAKIEHDPDVMSKEEALEYSIIWLEKKRERDEFIESKDNSVAVKSQLVSSISIEGEFSE